MSSSPSRAPGLSVVVPVHNAAPTIIGQLDAIAASAAEEGTPTIEIVVVDNRSSDDGMRLVAEWSSTSDLDLRIVDAGDQAGEPYARNVGFRAARAERIAYCDADDEVSVGWVGAMADALKTAPFVTGPLDVESLNAPWLAPMRGSFGLRTVPMLADAVPFANGCNMGFRREVLDEVGGFDEAFMAGTDIEIAVRLWRRAIPLAFDDRAVIRYRYRSTLRDVWRQGMQYGRYRTVLHDLVRDDVEVPDRSASARRLFWLGRTSPKAAVDRSTRYRWVWTASQVTGELVGTPR